MKPKYIILNDGKTYSHIDGCILVEEDGTCHLLHPLIRDDGNSKCPYTCAIDEDTNSPVFTYIPSERG